MKQTYLVMLLTGAGLLCSAQNNTEKERLAILKEGVHLYKLELASWNASDLLDSVYGYKTLDSITGYVSYKQGNSYNTVFYGGPGNGRVYAHFVFDSLSTLESAFLDMTPRQAGATESALIRLREDAIKREAENTGGFFIKAPGIDFNFVPVISGDEKKVYMLSAGDESEIIYLGNDYLLNYSKDYSLLSRKRLHNDLIKLSMEDLPAAGEDEGTFHVHKSSESPYITPTDICTLLLYADYADWDKHLVFSDQFVSIFDVRAQSLTIITRKDYEKRKLK